MRTVITTFIVLLVAFMTFSQEAASDLKQGAIIKDTISGLNLEMVFVKGGTFIMGCGLDQGRDCNEDEKPTHQVNLNDFYIGKYEVTQKQWFVVMGNNPSNFSGCDNCPVENVSWNEVQEFIIKLNKISGKTYRLPSEAQWEYAARGGESCILANTKSSAVTFKYAGSNNISEVAWYNTNKSGKEDKEGRTQFIGKKKPNELGLYDMSGNVWEWCNDIYDSYSSSKQSNPEGAVSGAYRVFRGGSWNNSAEACRVFFRHYITPNSRYYNLGFRLALAHQN